METIEKALLRILINVMRSNNKSINNKITYGEVANALNDMLKKNNFQVSNYWFKGQDIGIVLGVLGRYLKINYPNAPIINSYVVNKQSNLPGKGLSEFVDGYDPADKSVEITINRLRKEVIDYQDWDKIINNMM